MTAAWEQRLNEAAAFVRTGHVAVNVDDIRTALAYVDSLRDVMHEARQRERENRDREAVMQQRIDQLRDAVIPEGTPGEVTLHSDGRVEWNPEDAVWTPVSRALLEAWAREVVDMRTRDATPSLSVDNADPAVRAAAIAAYFVHINEAVGHTPNEWWESLVLHQPARAGLWQSIAGAAVAGARPLIVREVVDAVRAAVHGLTFDTGDGGAAWLDEGDLHMIIDAIVEAADKGDDL